jgi:hypothetical protein
VDNLDSAFDKPGLERVAATSVFWGSRSVVYEFWIPTVFIALAEASMLIDIDEVEPLEPRLPNADDNHEDLSILEDGADEFVSEALARLEGYPVVAANDPTAPGSTSDS